MKGSKMEEFLQQLMIWWIPGIVATQASLSYCIYHNMITKLAVADVIGLIFVTTTGWIVATFVVILGLAKATSWCFEHISKFKIWEKTIWEKKNED